MEDRFSRTEMLIGKAALDKLKNSRVAVFGLGGVGGAAVEALARAGVGSLDIIDNDKISITNINRQLIALESTVGEYKAEAIKHRLLDINPDIEVDVHICFFMPDTSSEFNFRDYDYVVDAIDTVTAKLAIIETAKSVNVPIISCMGTGNKLNPTKIEVADIYKTTMCPLAKVMRRELKARGVKSLKVVYSTEEPKIISKTPEEFGRHIPSSISFVPPVAGYIIASEVVKDLISNI